jgi:hypothetical protein
MPSSFYVPSSITLYLRAICMKWKISSILMAAVCTMAVASMLTNNASAAITPTEITETGGLHFQSAPPLFALRQPAQLAATAVMEGVGSQAALAVLTANAEVTTGCLSKDGMICRASRQHSLHLLVLRVSK